jgi:hypothetical protein
MTEPWISMNAFFDYLQWLAIVWCVSGIHIYRNAMWDLRDEFKQHINSLAEDEEDEADYEPLPRSECTIVKTMQAGKFTRHIWSDGAITNDGSDYIIGWRRENDGIVTEIKDAYDQDTLDRMDAMIKAGKYIP